MRLRARVLQMMLLASTLRVSSSVLYHFCRSPMSFVGNSTWKKCTQGSGDKYETLGVAGDTYFPHGSRGYSKISCNPLPPPSTTALNRQSRHIFGRQPITHQSDTLVNQSRRRHYFSVRARPNPMYTTTQPSERSAQTHIQTPTLAP